MEGGKRGGRGRRTLVGELGGLVLLLRTRRRILHSSGDDSKVRCSSERSKAGRPTESRELRGVVSDLWMTGRAWGLIEG